MPRNFRLRFKKRGPDQIMSGKEAAFGVVLLMLSMLALQWIFVESPRRPQDAPSAVAFRS